MTKEEAIEVYKGLINTKIKEAFEFFAPELRESEDERIREDIIGGIMWQRDNLKSEGPHDNNLILPGFCLTVGEQLAYLEKQKEQKPAEINGEDERIRKGLIHHLKELREWKAGTMSPIKVKEHYDVWIAYLEKIKDASYAIEAVERIDKYIDEHVANAHDMKDSNPDKKYYRGWDDALGEMARILQDVYSEGKQKEQKPEEKPINWTELTWEDINELEDIINKVHYEFRNGIGQESFGKEVLEKFREYKGDEYLDEIEQKPILEVFGFRVGDAVRLKDGDGRKHIIESFEENEGLHGPNFYRVVFEDNAVDYIFTGDKYPNGYYTQMEKFEEEQKPLSTEETELNSIAFLEQMGYTCIPPGAKSAEWSEEDEKMLDKVCCLISPGTILNASDADYCLELKQWIVSLQERILKSPVHSQSKSGMKI